MEASNEFETGGVRVAVEGCGHGTLNAIYSTVRTASAARGWNGVDLLIIGGDFQAVRNAADLTVMSVPAKFRELGDFPSYYRGDREAPYLTIFIGGNHEASSHLWELYYGGWVAPKIYYMGAANVLRLGPIRIAGMSGIWKGHDYKKPHIERLPFNQDDIRSFYHVREIDVRKLLLIREQVDVGLSHDWPRLIERHGNEKALWEMKPDFRQESYDNRLGNPVAGEVMDRLRTMYWFSAHMHCKFSAIKTYTSPSGESSSGGPGQLEALATATADAAIANPDEIDLDMDDNDEEIEATFQPAASTVPETVTTTEQTVPDDLRAQLPDSFAAPKITPYSPPVIPSTITNTTTRFLALDKCLPGRKFIELLYVTPVNPASDPVPRDQLRLQYDPEWLAITRSFHLNGDVKIGDRNAISPQNLGEAVYMPMIEKERVWVDENIVDKGKLDVPLNFSQTASPQLPSMPKKVDEQPDEYTNPQMTQFCELLGIDNLWDASPEERTERKSRGPPPESERSGRGSGSGFRGGRGGGRGGRGRGQGGRGRGMGRW